MSEGLKIRAVDKHSFFHFLQIQIQQSFSMRIRILLGFLMRSRIQVKQICEKLPSEEFSGIENTVQQKLLKSIKKTGSWFFLTFFPSGSGFRRENDCISMRIRIHSPAKNGAMVRMACLERENTIM